MLFHLWKRNFRTDSTALHIVTKCSMCHSKKRCVWDFQGNCNKPPTRWRSGNLKPVEVLQVLYWISSSRKAGTVGCIREIWITPWNHILLDTFAEQFFASFSGVPCIDLSHTPVDVQHDFTGWVSLHLGLLSLVAGSASNPCGAAISRWLTWSAHELALIQSLVCSAWFAALGGFCLNLDQSLKLVFLKFFFLLLRKFVFNSIFKHSFMIMLFLVLIVFRVWPEQ